jgi:hypothetical protein
MNGCIEIFDTELYAVKEWEDLHGDGQTERG